MNFFDRLDEKTANAERGKVSHLSLRPALRSDTGFYVCNAKNRFGSGAMTIRLTVFGKLTDQLVDVVAIYKAIF